MSRSDGTTTGGHGGSPADDVTTGDRVAFHMAEFEALKAEIAELVKQTGSYMTFAITASGGIAAWLLTNRMEPEILWWARWLPLVVSALFGCFAMAAYLRMADKGRYLQKIEERLGFDGLGWERAFGKHSPLIGTFQLLGWGAMNALGLFMALAQFAGQPESEAIRPPPEAASIASTAKTDRK